MGNSSSTVKNKNKNKNKEQKLNFKDLNYNNTEFISKLNEIATDYILGQNFQDMVRLTNSKYCDDLVIITSKILKKSFFSNQIEAMYSKISETNVEKSAYLSKNINTTKEKTQKMCIEISKYYVKIAHLFAAIITTLNPVFSWRSSASSSRAVLTSHVPNSNSKKDTANMVDVTDVVDAVDVVDVVEMKESGIKDGDVISNIERTTLQDKHYISEMAKDVKVENLNFCNSRIADLIDMDEFADLINEEGILDTKRPASEIKIKTKLCSTNLNNLVNAGNDIGDGIRRSKTVYDLPGFAELSRLYNDKYNTGKGRFDRMSAKSREEKKRNVDLLYTLFTGNPNPSKDIKSFRDIPIHSFSDTTDCSAPDSMLNKTYIGTTKDKLFVDYVEQIKIMIYDSNMVRNSLLEIIDKIFISNDTEKGEDATDVEDVKIKYIIDPNLTYEDLNNLIDETRKIILKLYMNCEKNFIHALKILQAIIEAQIFETGHRQIKELESKIEEQY
jgi:hypothetical protein